MSDDVRDLCFTEDGHITHGHAMLDTNYRAAQAVTIYTTSDSETLKKTVQQEKITYILFEEGSEFEQQECREETIAAAYEKVYETQDGRIQDL